MSDKPVGTAFEFLDGFITLLKERYIYQNVLGDNFMHISEVGLDCLVEEYKEQKNEQINTTE